MANPEDNPITPFSLRNEIPDLGLEIADSLVRGWVDKIRAGEFDDVSDVRRSLFADRAYSVEEQLDEVTTNLAVALCRLAAYQPA